MGEEAASFFGAELSRALPVGGQELARAGDQEWQRALALLSDSGCGPSALRPLWETIEAAALADLGSVKALSAEGLVAAIRAAALVKSRTGTIPDSVLVERLLQRIMA